MTDTISAPLTAAQPEGPDAGRFTEQARRAATQTALPLLATYAADAPSWGLEAQSRVIRHDESLDQLSGFLRMRVALAAGRRLEKILHRLLEHPNFYYQVVPEESIGSMRGHLDVPRYLQTRLRPEAPRRFPVRVLRRGHATDENVLAAYAVLWVLDELRLAPLNVLPSGSPERREIQERRSSLSSVLRSPPLAAANSSAQRVARRRELARLMDRVDARLRTGRIGAADAYGDLARWMKDFRPHDVIAAPGDIEWLFYDARFDTKLFEVWSLALLVEALDSHLGPPTIGVRPLYGRTTGPLAVWRLGAATISLHFQPMLSSLGLGEPRWQYSRPVAQPLRGFPDLGVTFDRVDGSRRVVLIDPKLRQRSGPPVEEIYKLLGYFGNLNIEDEPVGSILFYSPGDPRIYELRNERGGVALALGVDPVDIDGSRRLIGELVDLVLADAGISREMADQLALARHSTDQAAEEEAATAIVQASATQALRQAAASLPAGNLEPFRNSIEAQLFEVSSYLSEPVMTMVVTAEYFGHHAPAGADHSGPLLGLAAASERVLYEGLFDQFILSRPYRFSDNLTLGAIIRLLADALRQTPTTIEGCELASALEELENVDTNELRSVLQDLRTLNVEYRIPAAHREVIARGDWIRGRAHVLDPSNGVLPRLVRAVLMHEQNETNK